MLGLIFSLKQVPQARRLGQKLQPGHVHADGRIARGRGKNRNPVAVGRGDDAHFSQAVFLFEFIHDFSEVMIKFPGSHFLLEFRPHQDSSQPSIRFHQNIFIIEENVVDPGYALLPQIRIIHEMAAAVHGQVEGEMQVVIHIRAGGGDPVHETVVHQRNDGGRSQAGRGQGPGQAQTHGHILLGIFVPQQMAGRPQPAAVVGVQVVDQFDDVRFLGNRLRKNPFPGQVIFLARTV